MKGPSPPYVSSLHSSALGSLFKWENGNAYIEKLSNNILSIRVGGRTEQQLKQKEDTKLDKKQSVRKTLNKGIWVAKNVAVVLKDKGGVIQYFSNQHLC